MAFSILVLAEAAVTESLTRIVNEPDEENYSARKSTLTPRTVTEVLGKYVKQVHES